MEKGVSSYKTVFLLQKGHFCIEKLYQNKLAAIRTCRSSFIRYGINSSMRSVSKKAYAGNGFSTKKKQHGMFSYQNQIFHTFCRTCRTFHRIEYAAKFKAASH